MVRANVLAVIALVLAACGNAPGTDEIRSEITEQGDTTTVTTRGEPAPVPIDDVRVIWRSPELENPRALLAASDGRLIVGDPTRLHILTLSGDHVGSVGRAGAGPGEFGSIVALGRLGADTVAVHDVRHQRISFFTPTGEYLGATRVTPMPPYVNPEGPALAALRGGMISLWRENIHSDRPTRTALVWRDLRADTAAVLARWDGERYVDYGGRMFAPPRLFGPRVIAALASDGHVAVGDGMEYCVGVRSLADGTFRKACRVRTPVPVGEGVRDPDLSRIEDEGRREALANIMREQEIGDHLPSFDRLLFDEQGRLWIRTLGPGLAEVHPYLRDTPDLEPDYRTWDVFDTIGHLVGVVEVPSNFEPQAVASGRIFGFLEMATGEITIGVAAVPMLQREDIGRGNGG